MASSAMAVRQTGVCFPPWTVPGAFGAVRAQDETLGDMVDGERHAGTRSSNRTDHKRNFAGIL
jgi:hypothetical protein